MKINESTFIEMIFKCWVTDVVHFYPMTVSTMVDSEKQLEQEIKGAKEEYEKDFIKVDYVKTEIF